MTWSLKKLPVPALCALAGLAAGALVGSYTVAVLDSDRPYKVGTPVGSIEIGASQNSPISKCNSAKDGLKAVLASEEAELSQIDARIAQKQKVVDDMRALYLSQGIAQVSSAREQADYDARHSDITGPRPMGFYVAGEPASRQSEQNTAEQPYRITSSYMLNDNINELRTMQAEYSKQQTVQALTRSQVERLGQECFGVVKKP